MARLSIQPAVKRLPTILRVLKVQRYGAIGKFSMIIATNEAVILSWNFEGTVLGKPFSTV